MTPDKEKVEEQTKYCGPFKDADEYQVRLYVASVLLNEDDANARIRRLNKTPYSSEAFLVSC